MLAAGVKLSAKDRDATKKIARELPKKIEKKLVIDWRKSQRARAAVKVAIKDALDALPDAYGPEQYDTLVEAVYDPSTSTCTSHRTGAMGRAST